MNASQQAAELTSRALISSKKVALFLISFSKPYLLTIYFKHIPDDAYVNADLPLPEALG